MMTCFHCVVCLWIQCVCGVIKPQWGLKAWQSSSDPRPPAAALAEHNWKVFMRSWHLDIWTGFPIILEGKWWRSFTGVWHLCTVWHSSEVLCGCIKADLLFSEWFAGSVDKDIFKVFQLWKKIWNYVSVFMHNSWFSRGKTTIAPSAVWTRISSDSEVRAGHSRIESAEVRRRAQKQSQYALLLTQVTFGGVQMNFCSLFHHQLHNELNSDWFGYFRNNNNTPLPKTWGKLYFPRSTCSF